MTIFELYFTVAICSPESTVARDGGHLSSQNLLDCVPGPGTINVF